MIMLVLDLKHGLWIEDKIKTMTAIEFIFLDTFLVFIFGQIKRDLIIIKCQNRPKVY